MTLALHITIYSVPSAGDKPNLNDLMYMSYTGKDGEDVHFRLMDRVKRHWRRLAVALKFIQHEIDAMESKDDPVYCLLTEWLRGANMENDPGPVTWRTLITALRVANIQEEATVLENHLIQIPKATSGKLMIYMYVQVDSFVVHAGVAYNYMYRFVSYVSHACAQNCQETKHPGMDSLMVLCRGYISGLCMYIVIIIVNCNIARGGFVVKLFYMSC